ncbi:unnamed protein product [Scytosiphon promiscuus]
MALDQEGDCHIVEGYVVDHSLLLKSRSVGYLSEMGAGEEAATATTTATARRPPKISVTLSEYLSAASPNPDPSCDFGWFTPTASASSLAPAAGECQEAYFGAPSPSSHPTSFLFPSASIESAARTAVSMSPDSVVFGNGGGGGDSSLQCSCRAASAATAAASGAAARENNSGYSRGSRQVSFQQDGSQEPPPSSIVRKDRHSRPTPAGSSSGGYAAAAGTADDGTGGGGGGEGSMGVRLLPVAHSRSTTAHLNSWHTLYPHVSDRRRLASVLLGRCTLHLRRMSFPISTRHFPEKPPTPRTRSLGGGRNASASSCSNSSNSSSNSSSSSNSNGKGEGTGLKVSNGPPLARGSATGATTSQQQQQQQQRRDGGGRDDPSAGRTGGGEAGGGGGGPRKRQQQQSCSWAITELRVVQPPVGAPFAQYLVVVCMGREKLVAGWRRASDFDKLARAARRAWMSKACIAWEALERARRNAGGGPCSIPLVFRPRRLDAVYLQNKARFLEEFLKQYFFEAGSKEALLSFVDTSKPATMEIG